MRAYCFCHSPMAGTDMYQCGEGEDGERNAGLGLMCVHLPPFRNLSKPAVLLQFSFTSPAIPGYVQSDIAEI